MVKFRKKPIEVEAIQFQDNKESFDEIRRWVGDKFYYDYQNYPRVFISTLEGEMGVTGGDWIIRGVKGEFYPCKPDIFEAAYEFIK